MDPVGAGIKPTAVDIDGFDAAADAVTSLQYTEPTCLPPSLVLEEAPRAGQTGDAGANDDGFEVPGAAIHVVESDVPKLTRNG